uniref:Cytochrome P450 CYP302A1 n=1 Tax=Tigriopus japonicus TaxID=158387 RepID=A0A088DIC2_TIGJA|nr:cytochrome P450 CYP302A1 [Tigriopus japonicus]
MSSLSPTLNTTRAATNGLIKPFKDIPGPKALPFIGTLHHYFITKKYSFEELHKSCLSKYNEFGPIVREQFAPDNVAVWLFNPEDIQKMYETEGKCPARRSHLALEKYRLDHPESYNNGGLLPTNGPEWMRIRQAFQPLLKPQKVEMFLGQNQGLCDDFIAMIRDKDTSLGIPDFLEELKKYFLELTVLFFLNERIDAIVQDLSPNSTAHRLMEAAMNTNENVLKTDNGLPLWRWFDTKAYKSICEGQAMIESVATEAIQRGSFQYEEHLDKKDAISFVADMLLAGIDTTSYTMSFLLYHLSRNPSIQDQLAQNRFDDPSGLKKYTYGKWVLQESLRLNPISIGNARILPTDEVFSGYHIPAGTCLISQNLIASRLDQNFDAPDEFRPERWERSNRKRYHPYLSLPFGFGKRMCIGRRLAEQGTLLLLNSLMTNFRFEWIGQGELGFQTKLINKPDRPLAFKLTHLNPNA